MQIISFYPEQIENWYSNGFYPLVSLFSRTILGEIPFSVGDCLYLILILFLFKWFWNKRKTWKSEWKDTIVSILSFASVFYFLFHALWALNYYREPLFEKMEIQKDYSDADLLAFTKKIIDKTNAVQNQLTKNDSLKVVFPYSQEQVFEMSLNGYKNLAAEYPYFSYSKLSTKKSLISLPLTYMGFGGYLNPFTNEAQVNYLKPKYTSPLTTCHEMAHQTGIGSESECNFIGFVTAAKNEDLYFQYSAYSFALRYALHNLEIMKEGSSETYLKKINKGVLKNFEENEIFWKKYQTPINTFFEYFYDNFLKANQQKDGMEGYNKFVGLAIGYEGVLSVQ